MGLTNAKHVTDSEPQTSADSEERLIEADTWEDLLRFVPETSPISASPFRAHALVLLAHADEVRRGGLAWELGTQGMQVIEVEDGMELLDYLDERGPWLPLPRPDVIVAELDMPGCSGLDAALAMRRYGDPTPIIFINVRQAPTAAVTAARLPNCRIVDGDAEGGALRAAVDAALRENAH